MNEHEAQDWLSANVSRETRLGLQSMVDELVRWNRRINLVSPSTLGQVWARHVVDSAQLLALAPDTATSWLDLGSGAGFPGMVLAIMLMERPGSELVCVESNGKKAGFLRHCARITGAPARVKNRRIENLATQPAHVITARALKPLDQLLEYCENLCTPDTILLFPKGRERKKEMETASSRWAFDMQVTNSISDANAAILRITNVRKK